LSRDLRGGLPRNLTIASSSSILMVEPCLRPSMIFEIFCAVSVRNVRCTPVNSFVRISVILHTIAGPNRSVCVTLNRDSGGSGAWAICLA
jgi:hypothetical protein